MPSPSAAASVTKKATVPRRCGHRRRRHRLLVDTTRAAPLHPPGGGEGRFGHGGAGSSASEVAAVAARSQPLRSRASLIAGNGRRERGIAGGGRGRERERRREREREKEGRSRAPVRREMEERGRIGKRGRGGERGFFGLGHSLDSYIVEVSASRIPSVSEGTLGVALIVDALTIRVHSLASFIVQPYLTCLSGKRD